MKKTALNLKMNLIEKTGLNKKINFQNFSEPENIYDFLYKFLK